MTRTCKFFAEGRCVKGDSCVFVHELNISSQSSFGPGASAFPAIERLNINPKAGAGLNETAESTRICKFFLQGACNKGEKCWNLHPAATIPPQQAHPDLLSVGQPLGQQDESSPKLPSDSRAKVPCWFLTRPGGCQNRSCPYLHAVENHEALEPTSEDTKQNEDEDQEDDLDFVRDLSGASVHFNDFGHILKVSLPTDFSLACITRLPPETTREALVEILRGLGFNLNVDCVRIPWHATSSATKATVKVEDPLFSKELSARLKNANSPLSAVSMPIDTKQTNCRKVHISWHKATRSVWLNFGNCEIANRVAEKFNQGKYKCLSHPVKSSSGKSSSGGGRWSSSSHNPKAWTIILSDVPGNATSNDVERAITAPYDRPRHVEMGAVSYQASDPEVSVEVRSCLEEHGPLESFFLAATSGGKRVKATAWFQDEADARSACSLDNKSLDILKKGKLTVTLVQSAKIKVSSTIYFACKSKIDEENVSLKERRLVLHVYSDSLQRFTTLKVEGGSAKDVTGALKKLEKILSGDGLENEANAVWSSALNTNGSAYQKLKLTEKELKVVIIRDKSKRKLRFYGPPEKFQQALHRITNMLREEPSTSYEIDLKPHEFSWTMRGGFKTIEEALGKNIAIFSVISKIITINGTKKQYETAKAIMDSNHIVTTSHSESQPSHEENCPICLCEADTPIQTSCKHTYCLECLEECCKSAASTSKDEFQIKCQGDEGNCSTVFSLRELRDYVSSSIFEIVLKSSFEEYIQRHPGSFHYCPTPDCGYIFRCPPSSGSKPPSYTCPNCFEPVCTSCHARHGDYSCAEYKDIASGGFEALKKLKKELNIKDCPKCTTPMEKTEGCNHMTCGGCKAHICWVCMAVFNASGPCYDHMNKKHGGIGLGLERFAF